LNRLPIGFKAEPAHVTRAIKSEARNRFSLTRAGCNIPAGEDWKKVIGSIFV
jgi:uncharacterized protein YbdZ (MbtH family)